MKLISYDLRVPGKDYSSLYLALKRISAEYVRPLESVWIIKTGLTENQIFALIKPYMDDSDNLLVVDFNPITYSGWFSQSDHNWISAHR